MWLRDEKDFNRNYVNLLLGMRDGEDEGGCCQMHASKQTENTVVNGEELFYLNSLVYNLDLNVTIL